MRRFGVTARVQRLADVAVLTVVAFSLPTALKPWRSAGRRVVVSTAACTALMVLLLAAALPPVAGALGSRFSINGGAAYSRSLRVTLGDGGWSPFFEPGVVVWDGGSIIGGHGLDDGLDFPTLTLSLVPRACRSYLSITSNAGIADMVAEGPTEVDARHRADADLDLCLVLAGGGDFLDGADPASVYESLKTYCAARRAAGFEVIVLTVLPRSTPSTFEAARTAYNQLLRDNWPAFADGLADIAADPRIGDALDNLDRQYYGADATHPNMAGYTVMAGVTAPVINSLTWRSATCEMRVSDDGTTWSDWRPYVAKSTWQLSGGDGTKTVQAEFRDGHGSSVVVADSIWVDTVRPTTVAMRNVSVRRGATVTLPCRVSDPAPCGPTADVVVTVTTLGGRTVKRLVRQGRAVNAPLPVRFFCSLPKGAYRFTVRAHDTAGNPQRVAGSARLTVR